MTDCWTQADELCRPYYFPIVGGKIIGFILFPGILVLCEIQTTLSWFWTRIAESISYDSNHYTVCVCAFACVFLCVCVWEREREREGEREQFYWLWWNRNLLIICPTFFYFLSQERISGLMKCTALIRFELLSIILESLSKTRMRQSGCCLRTNWAVNVDGTQWGTIFVLTVIILRFSSLIISQQRSTQHSLISLAWYRAIE